MISTKPPKLRGINHIHLSVPDKLVAAKWYEEMLGFRIVDSMLSWNTTTGPLTIEDESGRIHLALFASDNYTPTSAVAFDASGEAFLLWKRYLEDAQLLQRCSNHKLSWSLYFNDPFGHSLEITSEDTEVIDQVLAA